MAFRGAIDFARLAGRADAPLPIVAEGSSNRVVLPGVELQWNVGVADVAFARDVLVVATRGARDDDAHPARGEAAAWLERYARHGERVFEGVDGGFAIAIVDVDVRRALLAVDRFSIQTLCYRYGDGKLDFADRAGDFIGGASTDVDLQSLYDYLYFHVIPAPRTAYRGVHRIEPAHVVSATASSAQTNAYWTPTFVEDDRRDLRARMRDFVDLVQASVAAEADCRATGCFLSGGTDSSTVAGMLARIRGEPARTYSIGFAAAGYDEMHYARIAARHFGLDHHEYYVSADDVAAAIPLISSSSDQPFGNSSLVPAYYCALRARGDGIDKMLAGDGGDELFAGNSRYATQQTFELYHRLPRSVRQNVLEPMATDWHLFTRVPLLRKAGGYVRHSRLPMPDRLESFNLLHHLGEATVFEPRFRESVDADRPREEQRRTWSAVRAHSLVNRMLAYDWKYTLADSDLPKVRSAAELAGVRVGYPLLSNALTDFSLRLPPQWKLKGWRLRWFFKRALRDFLPPEILSKKKHGFGLPFGQWALAHPALRRLVDDSLEGIGERGIVRRAFLRELLDARLPTAPGYYGELVWILMMLEQWLRRVAPSTRI